MSNEFYLVIFAIYLVSGLTGLLYAYIIYLQPWKKTYWEVVGGGILVILCNTALGWATYKFFGYLPVWTLGYLPTAFAAIGISQMWLQEKKHNEGHKRAKVKLAEHNGEEQED